MNKFIFTASVCVAFFFAACGDDGSLITEPSDESSSSVVKSSSSTATKKSSSSSSVKSSSSTKVSSSSNKVESSSSAKASSSSTNTPLSSWSGGEPEAIGSITDTRDGQTYKTVKIGAQTWMAENLNYETADSYCYNDSAKYCEKYGRLYTWAAAMDSAGTWSSNGKGCGYEKTCTPTYPVRGVCPEGWHLPTEAEFDTLFTAVGGLFTGKVLKSTSGWVENGNGTDDYSFSALPAGYRGYNGRFCNEGRNAYFWSSTENYRYNYRAYYMYLDYHNEYADLDDDFRKFGESSVRCVKD